MELKASLECFVMFIIRKVTQGRTEPLGRQMVKQSRLGWNLKEGPWEGERRTGCPEFWGGQEGLQGGAGMETLYHFRRNLVLQC